MRTITVNLSHDDIIQAMGEFVVNHRLPDFEGMVETKASMVINKRTLEITAHCDVSVEEDA